MRVAILDFGTNTFNLLIAERKGNSFETLYSGKEPVKLGKGGINKKKITGEAMERGFTAIGNHLGTIRAHHAETILAFATSAIRNAENGNEFVAEVEKKFGFKVQVIPGQEEAELIYRGIRESVELGDEAVMIMDIGGGSNEFILCNRKGILWKHSFELGMARIIERFNISDPIKEDEKVAIESYFDGALQPLFREAEKYKPKTLVGASGTFDTLAALVKNRLGLRETGNSYFPMELPLFHEIYSEILASTANERMAMKGMEPVRVEMIVPATIFINFVIGRCSLERIIQSDYALKEGAMARFIES